jgi:hypothetical protein
MSGARIWYPYTFTNRQGLVYRVSFRIAEEATWDHRLHDLDGRELGAPGPHLTRAELHAVQVSCDGAVGTEHIARNAELSVDARQREQAPHPQPVA